MKLFKIVSLISLLLGTMSHLLAATFYVATTGNDSRAGTSQATAWKTIARVNAHNYPAGSVIAFKGNQTFNGSISLNPDNCHGTPARNVKLTSFGAGIATIASGDGHGLSAYNIAGITVDKLNFRGNRVAGVHNCSGIQFYVDLANDIKLDGVKINNVNVANYGFAGIMLLANNGRSGYKNVRITNAIVHDIDSEGIYVAQPYGVFYTHENVTISYCVAYNIFGIPERGFSEGAGGNGIWALGTDGLTIDHCTTYNNGALNGSAIGGPYGNWFTWSKNVNYSYNENYNTRTGVNRSYDSGGCDIAGSSYCVVEYNYCHDNDGPAFLMDSYPESPYTNNILRYNISENDGKIHDTGSIELQNYVGAIYNDIQIYNNTIYKDVFTENSNACLDEQNYFGFVSYGTVEIFNNIFLTANGNYHVKINQPQLSNNIHLSGNVYWSQNGPAFLARSGSQDYTDMVTWQIVTGQEPFVSYNLDPGICNPGQRITVRTVANYRNSLARLRPYYELRSDSSIIDYAWDPFGYGLGPHDMFDQPNLVSVYPEGTRDPGAVEWQFGQNCD